MRAERSAMCRRPWATPCGADWHRAGTARPQRPVRATPPTPPDIRPPATWCAARTVNSSPFLLCFFYQLGEPVELVFRNVFGVEQRRHDALDRIAIEGFKQRLRRAPAHLFTRNRGLVNVARAVAFVPHMALLFENGQMRADRRVGRRIGNLFEDLRGRSSPKLVERIHDFALAPAEAVSGRSITGRLSGLASKHAKKLAPHLGPVNGTPAKGSFRRRMVLIEPCS